MDLAECKRKGYIKKTRPNPELAKSLKEMSDIKETVVKETVLDENNISAFVPMAYDSLREILEAVCIMNSYKVVSHICIEKLLETIYPGLRWHDFDRFRYIRNSINYYGKKMDFNQGKEIIKNIFNFKADLLKILNSLL